MRQSRYTDKQFRSLGYDPDYKARSFANQDAPESQSEINFLSQFRNVLEVIYSSKDGKLDYSPVQISENAPESVRTFINNTLMSDIPSIQSAPDDDTAFDLLVPRSVQTSAEFAPYRDKLINIVSEYRDRVSQNNSSPAQEP